MESNEYINQQDHLVELGESDYEIVDGEPDIKDWNIKNTYGQKIGEVAELLFDVGSRKVRYIIADLDDNELDVPRDRSVLIPIGLATIYESGKAYEPGNEKNGTSELLNSQSPVEVNERDVYTPEADGDIVVLPANADQLSRLPAYQKGKIDNEAEINIRKIFDGEASNGPMDYNRKEFYRHDHFNEPVYFDRGATMNSILPEVDKPGESDPNKLDLE